MNNKDFKPIGYNSVSPYLMIKDVNKFSEMLKYVFDATEKRKYLHKDGTLMHAEIQIDDSIIMYAEANKEYPEYPLWLHVYVRDVKETFRKAIEFGCINVQEPVQKEGDPDCRGTFKDFEGNNWAIGTQQNS
jgi:uncharacterized glyoxalase superfamily protein PhnB